MDRANILATASAVAVGIVSVAPTARAEVYGSPQPPTVVVVPAPHTVVVVTDSQPDFVAKTGLQLGVRAAYALGAGAVYSGLSLPSSSYGAIPFIVDVGWRIIPELYVGAYGQFAPVFLKTNPISCPAGLSCTAQDWRFGVELDYHFIPRTTFDPYVGLGFGYEILHSQANGTTNVTTPLGVAPGQVNASLIDRGWEWLAINAGLDFRLSSCVGLGPFGSVSFAEYNVRTGSQTATVDGMTIPTNVGAVNHAGHELFMLGLRGTFNL